MSSITKVGSIKFEIEETAMVFKLIGEYNLRSVPAIWVEADSILQNHKYIKIIIDGSDLLQCEGVGVSFLFHIKKFTQEKNIPFEVRHMQARFLELLDLFTHEKKSTPLVPFENNWYTPEKVGVSTVQVLDKTKEIIEFMGAVLYMLYESVRRPKSVKWSEVISISEQAGVNAVPIILLIGFLFGLIMSFQSAIPMQKFGAEIYVANLVALSLFRELGPLMTSVILAGRTASSFAAEIGTMKVSEEVDAIITMGLNPLQFLVIPRIIAALLVTPILTIFFNIAGLLGSLLVILSFNYPFVTFVNQVVTSVKNKDLMGGLFKATVFGIVIAGIGCYHGLNTKTGASSVGESTTRAVVNGIISIAVLDGIFSVLFFYLGF